MPFRRPTSQGEVNLVQEKDYILIKYRFFHDKIMDEG